MKDNGARSFVTVMIVIAVSSLLLRVAVEQVIRINIAQNESNAQATLKLISVALENYAKDHLGAYPESISSLIKSNPPYLDKDYTNESSVKGYDYFCSRVEASGYYCSAVPLKCKLTGSNSYTITTGGSLTSEDCSKKE
jgi:type II secretory pathway pseudopilin PulG